MELTTFMLADAAEVANGKLYVHGGQWDRIAAQSFPTTHASLAVVVVVRVEYTDAHKEHRLEVFLELDGEPVGPRAEGGFQAGHAPTQKHGAAMFMPLAMTFAGLKFESPGRYEWVLRVSEQIERRLPMELALVKK